MTYDHYLEGKHIILKTLNVRIISCGVYKTICLLRIISLVVLMIKTYLIDHLYIF